LSPEAVIAPTKYTQRISGQAKRVNDVLDVPWREGCGDEEEFYVGCIIADVFGNCVRWTKGLSPCLHNVCLIEDYTKKKLIELVGLEHLLKRVTRELFWREADGGVFPIGDVLRRALVRQSDAIDNIPLIPTGCLSHSSTPQTQRQPSLGPSWFGQ
jgi:hypothetical protein